MEVTPIVTHLTVAHVSAGGMHSCVVTDSGEVPARPLSTSPLLTSLNREGVIRLDVIRCTLYDFKS